MATKKVKPDPVREAEKALQIPDELQPERKRKAVVAWLINGIVRQKAERYVTPSGKIGIEKSSALATHGHYIRLRQPVFDRVNGTTTHEKKEIYLKFPIRTDRNEAITQGFTEEQVRQAFQAQRYSCEGRIWTIREMTQDDLDLMDNVDAGASQEDRAIASARTASVNDATRKWESAPNGGVVPDNIPTAADLGIDVPDEALALAGV